MPLVARREYRAQFRTRNVDAVDRHVGQHWRDRRDSFARLERVAGVGRRSVRRRAPRGAAACAAGSIGVRGRCRSPSAGPDAAPGLRAREEAALAVGADHDQHGLLPARRAVVPARARRRRRAPPARRFRRCRRGVWPREQLSKSIALPRDPYAARWRRRRASPPRRRAA